PHSERTPVRVLPRVHGKAVDHAGGQALAQRVRRAVAGEGSLVGPDHALEGASAKRPAAPKVTRLVAAGPGTLLPERLVVAPANLFRIRAPRSWSTTLVRVIRAAIPWDAGVARPLPSTLAVETTGGDGA